MPRDGGSAEHSDRLAAWLVIPLAALLTIILVVFYGLFTTSTVDGESMLPTLKSGERMLATKGYSAPIRGDIVIAHFRDGQGREHDVVKRVIGIPGDTVEVRNDVARVNGSPESPHAAIVDPRSSESFPPVKVPDGAVYLMGDNRIVSLDSRYLGTIPVADIQGQVEAIWAPINRVRRVN